MKKFLLLLLLTTSTFTFAQRDANEFKGRKKPYTCDDIIKTVDDLKGKQQQKLPNDFILSPVSFTYVKQDGIEVEMLQFYIQYYPYSISEDGVYFKLADGEIIKIPEAKTNVSYSSGSYSISCGIIMSSELINKLKNNFITQFSLGNKTIQLTERNIVNLQTLFKCMFGN